MIADTAVASALTPARERAGFARARRPIGAWRGVVSPVANGPANEPPPAAENHMDFAGYSEAVGALRWTRQHAVDARSGTTDQKVGGSNPSRRARSCRPSYIAG